MLDFPRWKVVSILIACALFILLALPNVLSESQRAALPGWMPSRTVNLGLDLQGGSHLLLKVDFDTYHKEYVESVMDGLRQRMRQDNVRYTGLSSRNGQIAFTLVPGQDVRVSSLLNAVDSELSIISQSGGSYVVGYGEAEQRRLRIRVLEKSIDIINRRVNETGTREPIIQRQGDDRILLQVPGLQDPELLKQLLGKTAKMTFHLVDSSVSQMDIERGAVGPGTMILPSIEKDNQGNAIKYAVKRRVELSGEMLIDAAPTRDEMNRPAVSFRFNPLGAKRFGEITTRNVGLPFAIVLDGQVVTAPRINTPILGGSGIITGQFTPEEANSTAILLRSGSLPAPLEVIEERTVGPSLGEDSIAAGKFASVVAMVLIFVFMFISYGLFGLFANIALVVNVVMILAFLSLFQATLTLPGITGIVLTIGMAVDANVLILERIREEVARGKSVYASVDNGFKIAYRTILDSNITTLIVAVMLFYFGTGTIKGFAVTLSVGIISSMFTAIVLTRLMTAAWMRLTRPKTLPI